MLTTGCSAHSVAFGNELGQHLRGGWSGAERECFLSGELSRCYPHLVDVRGGERPDWREHSGLRSQLRGGYMARRKSCITPDQLKNAIFHTCAVTYYSTEATVYGRAFSGQGGFRSHEATGTSQQETLGHLGL